MKNKIILAYLFLLSTLTKDKPSYSDEALSSLLKNCLIMDSRHTNECENLRNFLEEQNIPRKNRNLINNIITEVVSLREKIDEKIKRDEDQLTKKILFNIMSFKFDGELLNPQETRLLILQYAPEFKSISTKRWEFLDSQYSIILREINTATIEDETQKSTTILKDHLLSLQYYSI
jgi:hypothetical protein